MNAKILSLAAGLAVAAALPLTTFASTPSAPGAQVYIISPVNGAEVTSPVTVRFGLQGMGVAPAGMEREKTGHHHLLVDGSVPDLTQPLGGDVKHFGGGQTEVQLELAPDTHTLQLILGDHMHQPHNPPVVSEQITINVVQ